MHRVVLQACVPCLLMLLAGAVCLCILTRISGARLDMQRLKRLHSCQVGGVQSLSFVLTLPLFIMVVMFIVQVSQVMQAIAVVHYATYSAARAAIVWIPSNVGVSSEASNQVAAAPQYTDNTCRVSAIGMNTPTQQWKYREIWKAAVLGCAPISPSKPLYNETVTSAWSPTLLRLYASLVPSSTANPRIPQRLESKLAYSARNTIVQIDGLDKDGFAGPASYNPRNSPNPDVVWNPNELGWEDPLTITVAHNFALLPGPGKWLITQLANNGTPDRVSSTIQVQFADTGERIYTTQLSASLTLSNEGLKSVIPYVQLGQ